jgi:hypothetical protein
MFESCWRFVGTTLPTTFSVTNQIVSPCFTVVGRGEGVGRAGSAVGKPYPKATLKGKLTPPGFPFLEASISPSLQPLRAAVGFLRQVRTSCVQASGQKQFARRAGNSSAIGSSRR